MVDRIANRANFRVGNYNNYGSPRCSLARLDINPDIIQQRISARKEAALKAQLNMMAVKCQANDSDDPIDLSISVRGGSVASKTEHQQQQHHSSTELNLNQQQNVQESVMGGMMDTRLPQIQEMPHPQQQQQQQQRSNISPEMSEVMDAKLTQPRVSGSQEMAHPQQQQQQQQPTISRESEVVTASDSGHAVMPHFNSCMLMQYSFSNVNPTNTMHSNYVIGGGPTIQGATPLGKTPRSSSKNVRRKKVKSLTTSIEQLAMQSVRGDDYRNNLLPGVQIGGPNAMLDQQLHPTIQQPTNNFNNQFDGSSYIGDKAAGAPANKQIDSQKISEMTTQAKYKTYVVSGNTVSVKNIAANRTDQMGTYGVSSNTATGMSTMSQLTGGVNKHYVNKRNWRETFLIRRRTNIVRKIFQFVFSMEKPSAWVENDISIMYLNTYAQQLEKVIYDTARSSAEYYFEVALKLCRLRNETQICNAIASNTAGIQLEEYFTRTELEAMVMYKLQ